MRIPTSVDQIGARRVGEDVYVTLTVPNKNIDQFTPADVSRIEIFGYTGRNAPPRPRWVELGSLIATVPVAPATTASTSADETPAPGVAPAVANAATQGTQITIRDTLTDEELVQGKLPNVEPETRNAEPPIGTPGTNAEPGSRGVERRTPPLRRFYTAFAFSPRGRPGPPGAVAEFPLLPLPAASPSVDVRYNERTATITWEPAGGLLGFLLERTLPDEPLPLELDELLGTNDSAPGPPESPPPDEAAPLLYNVYRTSPPDPFAPPAEETAPPAWAEQPPTPVNPVPLATFEFTDPVEFGLERCYSVRAVRGTLTDARVGPSSPPTCVTPADTFAPAPPQGLATVASEGVISLIWEPNTERDLGGYIILRGEPADATLQPLTLTPITDAAYRDTAVRPGVRYVYAVVAVDNRFPVPNISGRSATQEETAR